MKILCTCIAIALSIYGYSQTRTFPKNQERFRVEGGTATQITTTIATTSDVGSALFESIAETMDAKDGYISLSQVDSHHLTVVHSSEVPEKDLLDVVNQFGIVFVPEMATQKD